MENRHNKLCLFCNEKLGKETPYYNGTDYLHTDCYFLEQRLKEFGLEKTKRIVARIFTD